MDRPSSRIDSLLKVQDLKKSFRVGFFRKRVDAVRGISFSVERGEIFGLVGPNGAGKTTTIKMLTGLIFPSSGSIELFGKTVADSQSRRRMGYLPESPYFYEHLTPRELLRYYGGLFGLDRVTLRDRTQSLLELVGLTEAADRRIGRFSKGMRQRAGIAQALINDPEFVILDEPQSGLDPVGRKEVRNIILHLKNQGKTVFFTSHILPDVEAVCDRVAVMHRGEVVEMGPLHELKADEGAGFEIWIRDALPKAALEAFPTPPTLETRGNLQVLQFGPGVPRDEAIRRTLEAGCRIYAVPPYEQSLEAIFLRDTGHARRTEESC